MNATDDLRLRTKNFALRVIRLYQALPSNGAPQVIGKQLLRCGTSVGANYRAAGRARSRAEFAAKLGIVVEEADESMYWLELLSESKTVKAELLADLQREAKELTAIFTTARQSAKR
jgi:four helix bundle protein